MLVTVTFEEQSGRTVQTFHKTQFLNTERRDAHMRGWSTVFDKQQAYVQSITKEQAA